MKDDLKKLYSDIIKTHNETPFHFEKRFNAQTSIKAYNPLCGDRFEIFAEVDGRTIKELYFTGIGCAISKASTSILAKSLEGKNVEEALSICVTFLGFINEKMIPPNIQDDFMAFSGIHEHPERSDCATLSWRETKRFLEMRIRATK